MTSLNLDDVSSSEEEDEGDGEDDDDDGDGGGGGDGKTAMRGSGRGGKRLHWRGEEEEGEGEGLGGGKRPRQLANVFAGVAGEGVHAAASVEEQMMQLDEQDDKARRSGRGVAGQGELRRAKEALR